LGSAPEHICCQRCISYLEVWNRPGPGEQKVKTASAYAEPSKK
jgi:hypothetical protein